jgi:hypothetical protein
MQKTIWPLDISLNGDYEKYSQPSEAHIASLVIVFFGLYLIKHTYAVPSIIMLKSKLSATPVS